MTAFLKRSRISKVMTDLAGSDLDFAAAESRLDAARVVVLLGNDQKGTAAGQAAALTALATALKCFANAALVMDGDLMLLKPMPTGATLGTAARGLGAAVAIAVPPDATHVIKIGDADCSGSSFVRCWWDGWLAGVVPVWDDRRFGASGNPLAGVFAGAVAVREVFASVLGYGRVGGRVSIASLWEPWSAPDEARPGPTEAFFPTRLWFIGLGHLGQGFLWAGGFLRGIAPEIVLQDDQTANEENEGTGLLTFADRLGEKKTRIAAHWIEKIGWKTSLIERRHFGDIPVLPTDPAIVVAGLDSLDARLKIASAGFDHVIDVGLGHGPRDFEGMQIRVVGKGVDLQGLWAHAEKGKDVDALMHSKAYALHAAKTDRCGTRVLASASVAVPFVGAAAGAATIAQIFRLTCGLTTPKLVQMEFGTPEMVVAGAMNDPTKAAIGSMPVRFDMNT